MAVGDMPEDVFASYASLVTAFRQASDAASKPLTARRAGRRLYRHRCRNPQLTVPFSANDRWSWRTCDPSTRRRRRAPSRPSPGNRARCTSPMSLRCAARQTYMANVLAVPGDLTHLPAQSLSPCCALLPWHCCQYHCRRQASKLFNLMQEAGTDTSPLAPLAAHRRVLGVVGLLYCPAVPDIAKAYAAFEKQCRHGNAVCSTETSHRPRGHS